MKFNANLCRDFGNLTDCELATGVSKKGECGFETRVTALVASIALGAFDRSDGEH